MRNRGRIVLDILVISALLVITVAGCVNNNSDVAETESVPASLVSDASETEATFSATTTETTKNTMPSASVDPTYEEAAAHVRDLLAEGNSVNQVIAILMDEGRTEFDATALVNSVLMEDEGTGSGGSSSSGTSTSSGNSDTGGTTNTTTATTVTQNNTGTTATQETTTATAQTNPTTGTTTQTSATTTTTSATAPETTPVPTKVKQTVYMQINWSDDTLDAATALGVDLNAERPTSSGYAIMACDANGNYSVASTIDRSDVDAAEFQMYAEADAILAKYGINNGYYTFSVYKYENEYLYD